MPYSKVTLTGASDKARTKSLLKGINNLIDDLAFKAICPQQYGAKADGITDDYDAINEAKIEAISSDKILYFPPGHYKVTTSPIVIDDGDRISIIGAGSDRTQIMQATTDVDLFQIGDTDGNTFGTLVKGLYVGTVAGTGNAFTLTLLHHSTFEDIYIPGAGNYGFYLDGCILNSFKHCEVSVNLGTTVAGITRGDLTGGGFYLKKEVGASMPCNANTFSGCVLEGGGHGYYIGDSGGDANTILGGCAEGHDTYAIYAINIYMLNVLGLWTEGANSRSYLSGCKSCYLNFYQSYGFDLVDCDNVSVTGKVTGGTSTIDANCVMCKVDEAFLLHGGTAVRNYSETSDIVRGISSAEPKEGTYGIYTRGYLLSENESLEYWSGGVPLPFKENVAGVTITQTGTGLGDTTKRSGVYAALIAKTSVGYIGLSLAIPIAYRGQWVSVECWVNNVAGQALVGFIGGVGANFYMSSSTATAVWQKLQYSFYYATDKTFAVVFTNPSADTTNSFYIDDIKIWSERNPYAFKDKNVALLSTTTVAFNADADTTLYTVPSGYRCVLDRAIVVAGADAGATTTLSIGQNGTETDFIPANTLSNLDAQYDAVILKPIPNTTPLKNKSYAASVIIEAQIANQSGGATNTVFLYGTLY